MLIDIILCPLPLASVEHRLVDRATHYLVKRIYMQAARERNFSAHQNLKRKPS